MLKDAEVTFNHKTIEATVKITVNCKQALTNMTAFGVTPIIYLYDSIISIRNEKHVLYLIPNYKRL